MCGIAGIFDVTGQERPVDKAALKRMMDAMVHRGPDGAGFFERPGLALGHRRLAIIDREGGVQPFQTASQNSALSFNGEIYNYRALAKDLQAKGVAIRTRSDTETLAEGLEAEGASFVEKLRGMFAFAYWREEDRTLSLYRDRFGEKPLYYAQTEDNFLLFASEVSAIAASGQIPLKLNHKAVIDYFHYGYVPDPISIYEGVHKLPPAHCLTVQAGGAHSLKAYWCLDMMPDDNFDIPFERACEELLAHLDEAVGLQLISDMPLGAFLSGGVDSSAIVAAMAHKTDKITACSIGFNEDSYDERAYARIVAERYSARHHEEVADLDANALIDPCARVYGEPFADASALPTYMVCGLAKSHVTVALTGDGADEIFAGYRRYPFFAAEEKMRNALPARLRRPLFSALGAAYPKLDWAPRPLRFKTTFLSLAASHAGGYLQASGVIPPYRAQQILSPALKQNAADYAPSARLESAFSGDQARPALAAAQQADLLAWLPGRMLTKVDRASMAHSLETRAPFLDHKLVEWAARTPLALRRGPGPDGAMTGKRLLKAAHETRLCKDILYRPKQGFGLPLAEWLRADKSPLTRLDDSAAWRDSGLINEETVKQMRSAHLSAHSDYSQELWSIIMFDAFLTNTAHAA